MIANAADFKPDSYVDTLNANLQEGDLSWSVKDGVLAPRASGQEKLKNAQTGLVEKILEAVDLSDK